MVAFPRCSEADQRALAKLLSTLTAVVPPREEVASVVVILLQAGQRILELATNSARAETKSSARQSGAYFDKREYGKELHHL